MYLYSNFKSTLIIKVMNNIDKSIRKRIIKIWDNYLNNKGKVLDTKGNIIKNIDENRLVSINEIKKIISGFLKKEINVSEFKTSLDSYNKRNNYWGFTAIKGQMFFNQLTKTNEKDLSNLAKMLKTLIVEPKNLKEALNKIDTLEKYTLGISSKAKDKRKVPNPGSVSYFLSYFWQIYNHKKWPIIYTSLIKTFEELNIWKSFNKQSEYYEYFYQLNEEIKLILEGHNKTKVLNWDVEHAFWTYSGSPFESIRKQEQGKIKKNEIEEEPNIKSSFDKNDFILPNITKLIGNDKDNNLASSAKGSQFEKLVAGVFDSLGFEVEKLGQGSGRNPDAIVKYRKESTAFIVDAKAYKEGYTIGIDDRAIKEYITEHCPKLINDGFKKVGFIIISNSFKSNFDNFIYEVTWDTDIKRFVFISIEALLYMLAYKNKDRKDLTSIIDLIVSSGNIIEAKNVIEKFDDL